MSATTFTEGIQTSMAPWAAPGSDLDTVNVSLGGMFDTVFGIVSDQGSPDTPETFQAGWSILLDPVACAAQFPLLLPFMTLFIGAVVPIGSPADTAYQAIVGEQGFQRGQGFGGNYTSANGADGGAIVTAAQTQLTGTQSVALTERISANGNPDAYHFVLVVETAQVVSTAALTSAVNAVKPGGVQWTLIETSSWTISELEADYGSITAVEAAFDSITALEGDVT